MLIWAETGNDFYAILGLTVWIAPNVRAIAVPRERLLDAQRVVPYPRNVVAGSGCTRGARQPRGSRGHNEHHGRAEHVGRRVRGRDAEQQSLRCSRDHQRERKTDSDSGHDRHHGVGDDRGRDSQPRRTQGQRTPNSRVRAAAV